MKHAPFFFEVFGETMRILVGFNMMKHHHRPLLTLHSVHGGQRYAPSASGLRQLLAKPPAQQPWVGLQRGQLRQRHQIVVLRGAVHAAATVVDGGDGCAEANVVAERAQDSRCVAVARHQLHSLDVIGELVDPLRIALVVGAPGEATKAVDRTLLTRPCGHVGMQRSRWTTQRFGEVAGIETSGICHGEANPCQCGANSGALAELGADAAADRDSGCAEAKLHRREQCVHAGEHGDIGRVGACLEGGAHGSNSGTECVGRSNHAQPLSVGARGTNDLGNAAPIVANQTIGCLHHIARTAIVHLKRMHARIGEQRLEIDEPRRIGTAIPIDGLVVVAHTKHAEVGSRQQPNQQHMRWREILKFVDQQESTRALGNATRLGVGKQQLERAIDLIVEIDGTFGLEHGAILRPERSEASDIAVVDCLNIGRATQAKTHHAERLNPCGNRVCIAFARKLNQSPDDATHIDLVDGSVVATLPSKRGAAVHNGQRDRVERAHAQPV